jgi:hypothetical protein
MRGVSWLWRREPASRHPAPHCRACKHRGWDFYSEMLFCYRKECRTVFASGEWDLPPWCRDVRASGGPCGPRATWFEPDTTAPGGGDETHR